MEEARREEEECRKAEREREADEQWKEQEKKKPKINPLDPNSTIRSWIAPQPSAYALNKIQQIEYIELDYFTPEDANKCFSIKKGHTPATHSD